MKIVLCGWTALTKAENRGGARLGWRAIGAARLRAGTAVVLFVVHVYREEIDGEEITRIISARRADKNEVRRYQEQEMD